MMPDFAPSVYFRSYLGTNSTFITGKINRTGQFVGYSDELGKIGKNIGNICGHTPNNHLLFAYNIGIMDRRFIAVCVLFLRGKLHDISIKILAFIALLWHYKRMKKLQEIKKHLRPGQVYRREDLAKWSNAVDRHLVQLQEEGTLTKLSGGLYYCPKQTVFGNAPADDKKLVEAFLRDHRFLLTSPNAYNSLGLGTTQLYNETVVYNHKRHGRFELGGRTFEFRVKPRFPMRLTTEFLLVDMVNNLDALAEDNVAVLERIKNKLPTFDAAALMRAMRKYGSVRTRKFFAPLLSHAMVTHAA